MAAVSWSSAAYGLARAAGRGAGCAVRASRALWARLRALGHLDLFRAASLRSPAGLRLEEAIREAVVAEVEQVGSDLTPREIDELVARIAELLGRALHGEIAVDAIPTLASLVRARSRRWAEPRPARELDAEKSDVLRRIFEENLALRQMLGGEGAP
ncbi:MAG: hypothetical protein Kow0092_32250 [Deferrisomatales bacterium]